MRGGGEGGGNSGGGTGGGEVVKEISSGGEWEKRIRLLGRALSWICLSPEPPAHKRMG